MLDGHHDLSMRQDTTIKPRAVTQTRSYFIAVVDEIAVFVRHYLATWVSRVTELTHALQ